MIGLEIRALALWCFSRREANLFVFFRYRTRLPRPARGGPGRWHPAYTQKYAKLANLKTRSHPIQNTKRLSEGGVGKKNVLHIG